MLPPRPFRHLVRTRRWIRLPPEIWLVIVDVFAARHDLESLFRCALVSRAMANAALPKLYGIHEYSGAISGDNLFLSDEKALKISVDLWRSIIASSIDGKTLRPYCRWIKTLKLGNLESCLEDLEKTINAALKTKFFSAPLEEFFIKRGRTRRHTVVDRKAVVVKVSDSITTYIHKAATRENMDVQLTTLEGYQLPAASIKSWVPKLNLLASLVLVDGSVLNSSIAQVIREHCPNFKDLECYFCQREVIDEQLAGFFSCLKPNTIQSFTIRSRNSLGGKTFEALNSFHSTSLKRLTLQDLDRSALLSLPALSDCVNLEKLILEGGWGTRTFQWEQEPLSEMKEWFKNCTMLKELDLTVIAKATEILTEALKHSKARLTSLNLKLVDHKKEFYEILANQTNLRQLTLKIVDDTTLEATDGRRDAFVNALCNMAHLRELDTNELFTAEDIGKISRSTHVLEELVLNGDIILDDFIFELSRMKHLRSINIFGPSSLTPYGLKRLIKEFEKHRREINKHLHDGLFIWIANQMAEAPFPNFEEALLSDRVRIIFGGKFEMMYRREPNELQESDFSE
ncbi:hypothetical protein QBC38DRAFT_353328 [Podospora fimiseda]|uniref:F-box domain-containing protein n=1 Tax=Podospora fimiseda TaxID=252190 RepID=A0AAN7H5R2_9PEZI|nr:hypothetical protein QBC38DRAFT_353328 [Podospora fimiseda]